LRHCLWAGRNPVAREARRTLRNFRDNETPLILDDNQHLRKFYLLILRSSGYEIVEAQNGAAGIEKSALDFVPPDIFSRFPPTGIRREEGPDFQPEIEMIDATDKSSRDLFEGEISSISGFAKSFSSTIIQLSTKNLTLDTPDPNPPG
jgi:hypothetical protein